MSSIYVQIAAYRDPELINTVKDLYAKAASPDEINVCIAWQHTPEETIDELKGYPRVTILDIPYTQTQGTCWARSMLNNHYEGEDYVLMLDSHHRFVDKWDEICVKMIKDLQAVGHSKPLLTGYIPSYDPTNDPAGRINIPWKMDFDRFIPEGAVFFLPGSIPDWEKLTLPLPARFFSGHFTFTLGSFVTEVPYDPHYYFHGEEINLAARAYTHGYDLFHPHRVVAWHEYTRKGRTKQWDDDKTWGTKNSNSHLRNRKLFEMDGEKKDIYFDKYDFGKVRTLAQYEEYTGICFKKRAALKHTVDKLPLPVPVYADREEFEKNLCSIFKHCIDIRYNQVPETDYDFWCVAFKDKNGKDVFRKDADKAEITRMLNDPDKYCKLWREYDADGMPASWLVWPHSVSKGWCDTITGNIGSKR